LAPGATYPTAGYVPGLLVPEVGNGLTIPDNLKGSGTVVFSSFGGDLQKAQEFYWLKPFEALTGIKAVSTGPVDLGKALTMAQTGNVEWDITMSDPSWTKVAAAKGLITPLDNNPYIDLSVYPASYGTIKWFLPTEVYSQAVAYSTVTFPDPNSAPQSWLDYWDTTKFPGPRGMLTYAYPHLEMALLVDGVAADKIYPIDVDRAFKVLDKIKSDIKVFWQLGAESVQLVQNRDVVMLDAYDNRFVDLIRSGEKVGLGRKGQVIQFGGGCILKGAPNMDNALKLAAFMCLPQVQASIPKFIGFGAAVPSAYDHIKGQLPTDVATYPPYMEGAIIFNDEWWAANQDAVSKRWEAWKVS
jgi:putative spermidine/putrescine transport system substrate-binding protein